MTDEDNKPRWVSNQELQLEIKALRSDVKLWILAAVALNQFLASVELPSAVTAGAVLGVLAKSLFAAISARGG